MTQVSQGTIHERLARVMRDVEAVKKGTSSGVNYTFRSVDAVFNEVHELLAQNGCWLSPRVLVDPPPLVELVEQTGYDERKKREYTRFMTRAVFMMCVDVHSEDGPDVVTWGPGMAQSHDYGDKAVYQAQQNAFKYIVLESLMIPTEDMRDNDMDGRHAPEIAAPAPPADAVPDEQVDTLKERGKVQVVALCDGDEDRARALTIEAARALALPKGWAASPEAWDKVTKYVSNFVEKAKAARQASAEQTSSEAVLPGPDAVHPEQPAAKLEPSDEAWAELYDLAGVPDPTIGTIPQIEQRTRRLYALMGGLGVWPADHFHSRLMSWYQAEHWGDLKVKANMQQFATRSFDEARSDLAAHTPEDAA